MHILFQVNMKLLILLQLHLQLLLPLQVNITAGDSVTASYSKSAVGLFLTCYEVKLYLILVLKPIMLFRADLKLTLGKKQNIVVSRGSIGSVAGI